MQTKSKQLKKLISLFYDHNYCASVQFKRLLHETNIKINGEYHITTVNKAITKANWVSDNNLERWHMKLSPSLENKIEEIIDICHNLGLQDTIDPAQKKYDGGILFLGSIFWSVVNRWKFFKKMITDNKLDHKQNLWVLTGERNLNKAANETDEVMNKINNLIVSNEKMPKNELDMIKYVVNALGIPNNVDVEYIYSEKEKNYHRATTFSTMEKFFEVVKTKGKDFIAISNQPYVLYQFTALKLAEQKYDKDIVVEVIGNKAAIPTNKNRYAAILLDTVAKISRNLERLDIVHSIA